MRKLLTRTCPTGMFEQEDRCCKQCPKGTYLLSPCTASKETECKPCPDGHFTENLNYLYGCLPCTLCDSHHHLQTSKHCTKESNTKCECMKGYYCIQSSGNCENHAEKCEPVHSCPPGQGVSVPPNRTHDTVCKTCPAGTFNNETDYTTPCRSHTSCSTLGRYLISDGTAETDAICGDFKTSCHWMIPASLWAGLMLTVILVLITFICWRSKRRGKAVITSGVSENLVAPALPPDVIKYPRSPELPVLIHNNKLCAEEDDGELEYDGISMNLFSEKCAAFSIPDTCTTLISEPFKSEPQEDDWPVL